MQVELDDKAQTKGKKAQKKNNERQKDIALAALAKLDDFVYHMSIEINDDPAQILQGVLCRGLTLRLRPQGVRTRKFVSLINDF